MILAGMVEELTDEGEWVVDIALSLPPPVVIG
jgi:hypothetical protein